MPGPLGMKDEIYDGLAKEQRETLAYIEELDLSEELRAVVANEDIDRDQRRSTEREFKRFLAIAYLPAPEGERPGGDEGEGRVLLGPSRQVDAVWHQFIVNTRAYHEFCERVYGRYLHHNPAADGRQAMNNALPRLRYYFEDVDEEMWSEAFICFVFRPGPPAGSSG